MMPQTPRNMQNFKTDPEVSHLLCHFEVSEFTAAGTRAGAGTSSQLRSQILVRGDVERRVLGEEVRGRDREV